MGLTAETVQVYSAGSWAANLQKRIAEVVVNHVTRQGYEEASREQDADRIVVVAPVSGGGWISVSDSDFGGSEKLAKEISKDLLSPAVSLTVFDSDDVFVRLFEGGKMLDRHECSGGKIRKRVNAEKWSVVADPDQRVRIGEILKEQSLFAEEQLTRLAEALGMSPESCVTPVEEISPSEDGFLRFYFRHPSRGKAAQTHAGPPALVPGPSSHPWRAAVGEHLPLVGMYAINQGGPMKGVRIRIEGSAIEDGLVSIGEMKVFNTGRKDIHTFVLSEGQHEVELKDFLVAEAPAVPAGLLGLAGMLMSRGSKQNRLDHYISVNLQGQLLQQGQGELHVVITPLENPDRAARLAYPLLVQPPVTGPLKADMSLPGASQRCRSLYTPRVLHGLYSFAPGKTAVTAFVSRTLAQWIAFLERTRPDGWFCTRSSVPLGMPEFLETKRNDLTKQRKWSKWFGELAANESLTAYTGQMRVEGETAFEGCAGFGFHQGRAHTIASALTPSPHLSLWVDTSIFTDDEVEEAERMLAAWGDEAANEGLLLQASLSRTLTGGGGTAEATPYEFACGVQGQCTMTSWWCERYLRMIGTHLWIGPELQGRIPSPHALSDAPDVTHVGGCLRCTPCDSSRAVELEKALAPILAGSTDWQQGMRVRYNRAAPHPF